MGMKWKRGMALAFLAITMQAFGLFLFISGFFPVKPTLTGFSGVESYEEGCHTTQDEDAQNLTPKQLHDLYTEKSKVPQQFDRVIFMVIDGLPAEFVLGKGKIIPSKALKEAMPYTHRLLSHGKAFGYHSKAAPPTVTMPRLKAMTSGAIAGFLDVAFNFHSHALLDDNILDQLQKVGWKMVMLGDETWLRLFPNLFIRRDGVSSFYVKDTIEVDQNVTRHLDMELNSTDWNVLILHYLGLDHVGHLGGRGSSLMIPKLLEMDEIIKKIHMSIAACFNLMQKNTLLMIVSDHGMTEGGNHGGSSFEETDALAIFIPTNITSNEDAMSTHMYSSYQVDIVPTLATLLGVPIPKNNIGIVLPQLLHSLTAEQKLRVFELNSWQLLKLLHARLPGSSCVRSACNKEMHSKNFENGQNQVIDKKICFLFQKAVSMHNLWRANANSTNTGHQRQHAADSEISIEAYIEFLRTASEFLARGSTEKPLLLVATGGLLMSGSLILFVGVTVHLCKRSGQTNTNLTQNALIPIHNGNLEKIIAIFGICLHALSLCASSLVEEEQYTWHFLTSTLCMTLILRVFHDWRTKRSTTFGNFWHTMKSNDGIESSTNSSTNQILTITVVLVAGRLLRGWHQGGVNWVHFQDIAKWLDNDNPLITKGLQLISILSVTVVGILCFLSTKACRLLKNLAISNICISGLFILIYKLLCQDEMVASTSLLTTIARIVYFSLLTTALTTLLLCPWIVPPLSSASVIDDQQTVACIDSNLYNKSIGISPPSQVTFCVSFVGMVYIFCWCLLQLLLQQPVNAFPITLLLLQLLFAISYFYNSGQRHAWWIMAVMMYWLGASGHFGLGNSNSLATVDVAGAYIGLSKHSIILSGMLAFSITYASPILFLFGLLQYPLLMDNSYQGGFDEGSVKSKYVFLKMISLPCLLVLSLNSIVLVTFTGVLYLMRNHLFVWSVFSPKYLYVCANTACVYLAIFIIAITSIYSNFVIVIRSKYSHRWKVD